MVSPDTLEMVDIPRRPLEDSNAVFLIEEHASWTCGRLLRFANHIRRHIPKNVGGSVGVCSGSASFVAAATMAIWSRGVAPMIFDPKLRAEPSEVFADDPDMPVLVSDATSSLGATSVVISEDLDSEPLRAVWPEPEGPAARFFTSGSTGEPKVVHKRGYQFFEQMRRELVWLGVPRRQPTFFAMAPPFHILGFAYGFFMPLLGRGSTGFLHGAPPAAWIDHMATVRPDAVTGVPSHYRFLVQSLEDGLPKSIYVSSGAPLTPDIDACFRERTGHTILQIYGSTETGGVASRRGFGPWSPFPGLRWSTRAEDGRLLVRSPWQEHLDQWVVTDDLARADSDGFQLLGRTDSVVKVGAKRFSSNEILQVALNQADVEFAEIVTYTRFGENAVALFVTPPPGCEPTPSGLRRALAEQLAPFKVPRTIRVLSDMPLMASGKVDRQRLARMAAENEEADPPA